MRLIILITILTGFIASTSAQTSFKVGKTSNLKFNSKPEGSPGKLWMAQLLGDEPANVDYDVADETFELVVSHKIDPKNPPGVFVWIDASDRPTLPVSWKKQLAEANLIWIAPNKAGNGRVLDQRLPLAVDAYELLSEKIPVNKGRVYISGFSGGARAAGILGFTRPDIFSGTACFMGAEFYKNIKDDKGIPYPSAIKIDGDLLAGAKQQNHFSFITGEHDFSRGLIKTVYKNGFLAEGFKNVQLLDIPKLGHKLPNGETFMKVLKFLNSKK